ncbi:MAG: acetyl-CoA carboxylase biotin carboxyl carrier protein subunit [Bacteroidales bacterium]|jgi:biotin carboxyl carrier protein|nr:acetyl-CoA carboxylase biotin carboxyl carrier protein subunit [Bacteroidales bacterium]
MQESDDLGIININDSLYRTRLSKKFRNRKPYKPSDPGIIPSFIPGTVLEILVKEGQKVNEGDDLIILDAMKMQNRLKCHKSGKIKRILVKKGDRVSKGTCLIEIE